jgi:hypothetical protein
MRGFLVGVSHLSKPLLVLPKVKLEHLFESDSLVKLLNSKGFEQRPEGGSYSPSQFDSRKQLKLNELGNAEGGNRLPFFL